MKRSGILNQPLSSALASLGHSDLLMVCDAGFPIPAGAGRVDLAIAQDLPDLRTVLSLIDEEFITEKVVIAAEVAEYNPPLRGWLEERFQGVEFEKKPHEEMLTEVARAAKVIVRTGAFEPWGNVGLISGVDAPRWFAKEGTKVPDYYRYRVERPRGG